MSRRTLEAEAECLARHQEVPRTARVLPKVAPEGGRRSNGTCVLLNDQRHVGYSYMDILTEVALRSYDTNDDGSGCFDRI